MTAGKRSSSRAARVLDAAVRSLAVFAAAALALAGALALGSAPKEVAKGSRSAAVHTIPIFDEHDSEIDLDGLVVEPISLRTTCDKCHAYETIRGGLHFNYADPGEAAGRAGEPWILADAATGTQIPISYRRWIGTWHPRDLGLTDWQMTARFAANLPGGGPGEPRDIDATRASPRRRWMITGRLGINCMACHSGSPRQDRILWATHIERQNFRWAATAASGLGEVAGAVANLPLNYDLFRGRDPDDPAKVPPRVHYDPDAFNRNGELFFDIAKRPLNDRCYACHSVRHVGPAAPKVWETDEDVHLRAGLRCVDCHRNGLDHAMSRGYAEEPAAGRTPTVAPLTCEGCHLGDRSVGAPGAEGGRLGAPVPAHRGLPPAHLEKMSCTSCHSGPWPRGRPQRTETSRSHLLGLAREDAGPQTPPHVVEPVFAPGDDGKIAPHRMLYPAFWAYLKDGKVRPILPQRAAPAIARAAAAAQTSGEGHPDKPPSPEQRMVSALAALAADAPQEGRPVYVGGGRMTRLAAGRLITSDHPAARPYLWPVAHDVRPAAWSLGAGGCEDCHDVAAPIFFGKVPVRDLWKDAATDEVDMTEFTGEDATYHRIFAMTFIFRPLVRVVAIAAAGLLAVILAGNLLLGLCTVCRKLGRNMH
jgi:hypothetical protein